MRALTLILLFGSPALAGSALDPGARFVQAAAAYDDGGFAEAAAIYESLLAEGVSAPEVYFNLGNAYFRSGEVGRAIWAYRAAARLAPRDPDIAANLTVARLAARDRIESVPPGLLKQAWRTLGSLLSLREGARLVSAAWLGLWILTLIWLFYRPVRRLLAPLVRLAAAAWVAAVLVFAARYLETRNTTAAVVVVAATEARSGPGVEFDLVFDGHAGLECVVRGQKNDFLLVELANERVGWLPANALALIPS